MSETSTGPTSPPVFPPGRYGRRRSPQGRLGRRLPFLLTAGGIVAGLALTILLYSWHGNPEYSSRVISYQLADDHLTVTFEVFKPANQLGMCHVRSRSAAGAEVGAADVPVGTGGHVTLTYTLATTGKPFTVEVTRCGRAP